MDPMHLLIFSSSLHALMRIENLILYLTKNHCSANHSIVANELLTPVE